ncbi:uncharacterized protein METZ01_LOCUS338169 [marine metagenome]|uniref:Uncharacterized protein n=1 Tax=marine metagenome TaxID=408172 RepID=A0A382QKA1_9ZZZZ
MAVRNTVVFTRLDTNVDWPPVSEAYRIIYMDWESRGWRNFISKDVSADGLTRTVVLEWLSEDKKFDFTENATVRSYFNERDIYCIENDITLKVTTDEI